MVPLQMMLGAAFMILALQKPSGPAPNPTPPPPLKTIIRMKTSPFCEAFRENVFHAVEGLRVNDRVIEQSRSLLAKTAYDGVVDQTGMPGPVAGVPPQDVGAPSVRMDQYQLGQVMGEIAHNLQRVYGLLNDPKRFAEPPQNDADRELATMKSALLTIADAQERSLSLISGQYETAALNDMFSRGDNTANLKLGDPILTSPGSPPLPAGGALPHGSLFAGTPVGGVAALVDISQRLTGDTEDQVLSAVLPGMDRCR